MKQVGIRGIPATRMTGCIVTHNTQAYPGDWTQAPGTIKYGIAKPNSYSVNPLTWVTASPGEIEPFEAPTATKMGALFYQGQLGTNPAVPFAIDPGTGNYTYEVANYTGARSNKGGLAINPSALPAPDSVSNLPAPWNVLPMFHTYDYTFFYRNLEQNVMDRINGYQAH